MNDKLNTLNNLTKPNQRFLQDLHRFQVVSAGRRSRKSLIGSRKILYDTGRGALITPNMKYLQTAPTHSQAKKIFWEMLKANTRPFWKKKASESELTVYLYNGSQVQVMGLDKPERLEGQTFPPIKGIHITEMGNCKPELWQNNIRPILSDTNGFAIIDGVPEGRNHYYDIALYASDGIIPETYAKTGAYATNGDWSFHSWFSSDVLDHKEIEDVKSELDPRTFRQEYEGSFEGFQGLAYQGFSEKNYTDREYIKGIPLVIGADFNINPMCWGEGQFINGFYYQTGESILINSNTREMCEHIQNKYNLIRNVKGKFDVTIIADASSRSGSTSATMSDIQIMQKFGFTVKARRGHSLQRDRIRVSNSAMNPSSGLPKYYVNPKYCKHTIEDWQKVQAMDDGRINKSQEKQGKSRVHISDGVTYLLEWYFPIKEKGKAVFSGM